MLVKKKIKVNTPKNKNTENLRLTKSQDQKPEIVKKKKKYIKKSLLQFSPVKSLNKYQEIVDNII